MTLFPRHGGTADDELQGKALAHRILDRLKRGEQVEDWRVRWALSRTGDLIEPEPEAA